MDSFPPLELSPMVVEVTELVLVSLVYIHDMYNSKYHCTKLTIYRSPG